MFTYEDLIKKVSQKEAAIKALNHMAENGTIRKLSKGRFYRPETTVFGELDPKQGQIVKDLLEKEGKVIGYLTGLSIYNRLGLTSQVGNTIQIGRTEYPPSLRDILVITPYNAQVAPMRFSGIWKWLIR